VRFASEGEFNPTSRRTRRRRHDCLGAAQPWSGGIVAASAAHISAAHSGWPRVSSPGPAAMASAVAPSTCTRHGVSGRAHVFTAGDGRRDGCRRDPAPGGAWLAPQSAKPAGRRRCLAHMPLTDHPSSTIHTWYLDWLAHHGDAYWLPSRPVRVTSRSVSGAQYQGGTTSSVSTSRLPGYASSGGTDRARRPTLVIGRGATRTSRAVFRARVWPGRSSDSLI